MRGLFRSSRWIHKYFGLVIIIFAVWMSFSGILLNHPELIAGISVPRWLVPPQYTPTNWNRSALITMVWSSEQPKTGYAAGKMGIWRTDDGGISFRPMMQGLPASAYYRKTYTLLFGDTSERQLYAGTEAGLFECDPIVGIWKPVPLGEERRAVIRIVKTPERLMAFTDSGVWSAVSEYGPFHQLEIPRDPAEADEVSLVKLFFDLHGGKAWGLVGKLIFDAAGIVIIILSVSAFYLWFYPWKRKRQAAKKIIPENGGARRFHGFSRWHNRLGIWFALVLVLIGFTGIFMRPPLLIAIAEDGIPQYVYPGLHRPGPWEEKIKNALYNAGTDEIILATTDGFWRGAADFSTPFRRTDLETPVFVMGATVFEKAREGGYLIGSFSGIFHRVPGPHSTYDLLSGEQVGRRSSVRPAEVMVTGYFRTPDGEEFVTAHEQGLLPLNGARLNGRFAMPAELWEVEMPLWNFLFELHNGRIFQDLIGEWYILIVPLGSILFFLVCLSGIYDWLHLTLAARKVNSKNS